jgi:hypothetical protein
VAQEKPAVLQDATFTVREGLLYRACRTGAIWMNKLFFSSLILLGAWVLAAYAGGVEACTETVRVEGAGDAGQRVLCNPFLTPTAMYLAGMAALSFAASILLGLLGLVVGKDIVQAAKATEEVGARRDP